MKAILIIYIFIEFINSTIVLTESGHGKINEYFYELSYSVSIGRAKMSINENNFTCFWKNIEYVDFLYGKYIDPPKKWDKLENLNYEAKINAIGDMMAGIHGEAFLYEFFSIIEYYSDEYVPPGISLGTIFVDDGEYEIYYDEKIAQPNIHGISKQIIFSSIRKEKRLKGTINLYKHFQSWKEKGCNYESISRIAFIIDASNSMGNATLNQIEISC